MKRYTGDEIHGFMFPDYRSDEPRWIDGRDYDALSALLASYRAVVVDVFGRLHQRSEVMNPPASAAQGAEAGNLNMEPCHGTGAVPRGTEARPADVSPPPTPAIVTAVQAESKSQQRRFEAIGVPHRPYDETFDAVENKYWRACSRCGKKVYSEQPILGTVVYCDVVCAD